MPQSALEPPFAFGDRAREASLLVSEQLRVDQIGRNRAAVDPQKRPRGPPRAGVDRPGDHLLARAGFTENQHGRVGARHELYLLHDLLEPRLSADDRIGNVEPA